MDGTYHLTHLCDFGHKALYKRPPESPETIDLQLDVNYCQTRLCYLGVEIQLLVVNYYQTVASGYIKK